MIQRHDTAGHTFAEGAYSFANAVTYGTVSSGYLVSGLVRTVGGMELIEEVQGAIGRALDEPEGVV